MRTPVFLQLTFLSWHTTNVIANLHFELQLAEDAAHNLQEVAEELSKIHQRAAQTWEHFSRNYSLEVKEGLVLW